MRRLFKYLNILIVLASLAGIVYGFILMDEDAVTANKFIGFGTVGLFLLAMPLFLIIESRGKKVQDYMITEENLRKMQGKKPKKSDNQ